MEKNIELVIMDMAGTTFVDSHEVEACFAKAAKETQLQMTDEEVLSTQGWKKQYVFETFWERQIGSRNGEWAEQVDNSFEVFKNILEQFYEDNPIEPTVGALDTFAYLKERDVKIALTTGFYRKVTDIILEKLGWLDGLDEQRLGTSESLVQCSVASDEVENGRPEPDLIFRAMKLLNIPDVEKVVTLGDTPSDLQYGRAAQCKYVCALTNGTHTHEQLVGYDNDGLFASQVEFRDFLKTVI